MGNRLEMRLHVNIITYSTIPQGIGNVHHFYQDISKLGRPEDDGSMSITTTMQVKFLSLVMCIILLLDCI